MVEILSPCATSLPRAALGKHFVCRDQEKQLSAKTILLGKNRWCSPKAVAETGIFFHQQQLRPGSTVTLSFPAEAAPAILQHDVAEKVPFTNAERRRRSAEAKQVRHTLSRCQAPPIAGEVKSCTASLEATVESAMRMLSAGGGDVWAAASELPRAGLPQQTYAVVAATQVQGDEYLSCHTLPFPYAVYQCHVAPMAYWAYKVSLAGLRDGSAVALLAICHLDTSGWNPAHPAFEVLQTKPGGWPVCHFMPYGNLAFVKTMATTA
ncbi:hypothetical protein EJB05_57617, partial [Eragrostis curvula]